MLWRITTPSQLRHSKRGKEMNGRGDREGDKGLIWKLPPVKSKQLGKLGPAFGFGAGCGVGFGLGLMGGAGIGPGVPGLQLGFGVGVGCGVGLGFGYGIGRGIAHGESRRYSNVGNLFHSPADFPTQDDIGALVDDLIRNTRKLIEATSREIDKWGR
ncbi:fibroin heavy chain isoform X2 [Punica granatum]|uniref:Fibroin heavy chain isoform X2 n=1 Tax=Punica granatum TaxID=22663 RepID=A0A6P8CSF3_PUNGR|nr:fibroin heavy chain isoform X2 [Punica granatum]